MQKKPKNPQLILLTFPLLPYVVGSVFNFSAVIYFILHEPRKQYVVQRKESAVEN